MAAITGTIEPEATAGTAPSRPRCPSTMHRHPSSTTLLLVLFVLGWLGPAQAHDPGLSRAVLQIGQHQLVMRITFAERELEAVVPMDSDQSGDVSAAEFLSAKTRLQSAIAAGVALRLDHQPQSPQLLSITQTPSDTVEVALGFQTPLSASATVTVPLIARLARGHRQYLTVRHDSGELLGQYVLDSQTGPLTVPRTKIGGAGVFYAYLDEGLWHIWIGFDHLLFLLTLMLPAVLTHHNQRWQAVEKPGPAVTDIVRTVTAFTVAHSITLALATLGIVQLPARLVESAIALSVLVTAVNNLRPLFAGSRWLLAFAFGLVHGLGFAHVLLELGLPSGQFTLALLGFNLGVELGQLAIVLLLFPIAWSIRRTHLYRAWVFGGGSMAAAVVAGLWLFERVLDHELVGF